MLSSSHCPCASAVRTSSDFCDCTLYTVTTSHNQVPKADGEKNASELIFQTVEKPKSSSPDAPSLVLGNFNHCSLDMTLRRFHQYESCWTSKDISLNRCYGSIKNKNASTSVPLPLLGSADHTCVYLVPSYLTCVWGGSDINEPTDVVRSWITSREDAVIPVKTVNTYPHRKPRMSRRKGFHNKKKQVFKRGNLTEHISRPKWEWEIRRTKLFYKQKVEVKLSNNDLGWAWD